MRTILTLVAVLALAASASAAMTLDWTITEPSPGLFKAVGTLTADEGRTVNAVDGEFTTDGTFNQVLLFGAMPSPYASQMGFPTDPLDTHFLYADNEVVVAIAAAETDTSISAAIGILGGTGVEDFIQILGVAGTVVNYDFIGADNTGAEFTNVGSFVLPEPASLGLLALGVLGLLRRR